MTEPEIEEKTVWGDAGYIGVDKCNEHAQRNVNGLVAMRPGKRAQLPPSNSLAKIEYTKACVRAKVEHGFFMHQKCIRVQKSAVSRSDEKQSSPACTGGVQ